DAAQGEAGERGVGQREDRQVEQRGADAAVAGFERRGDRFQRRLEREERGDHLDHFVEAGAARGGGEEGEEGGRQGDQEGQQGDGAALAGRRAERRARRRQGGAADHDRRQPE